MDPIALADEVERRLAAAGVPERAAKEQAYLRSELRHLGTSVPAIRRVTLEVLAENPGLDHGQLVALVDALWSVPVFERRMAAVELLDERASLLGAADLPMLERLIREARTWALVDGLAASVAGSVATRDPAAGPVLDRWVHDPDFWVRRAAILALLIPLRRGEGDVDRLVRYADALLDEGEPFIRKAVGWVLRDTARHRPELVRQFLLARIDRVSGPTLREAVRRLPEPVQAELIAARPPGPVRRRAPAAAAAPSPAARPSPAVDGDAR